MVKSGKLKGCGGGDRAGGVSIVASAKQVLGFDVCLWITKVMTAGINWRKRVPKGSIRHFIAENGR
ncbi:hypothetical protein DJICPGNB_05395 [Escherichia coli]|nr:hypothetical protein DJICPGNB_05395 [Escherichia coli]